MTKANFRRCLASLVAAQLMVGCGYIKSWFPDKERDYQFRTEIPELIVPEDLKNKTLPERTPEQVAAAAVAAAEMADDAQQAATEEPKAAVVAAKAEDKPAQDEKPVQPAPAGGSGSGVSSLQIDQSRAQAWRLVARALSRQRVEIVERNIDKGYFYVNYDPNAAKPEDGSIWDEVSFLFGDDPSHEQEYRVSLLQIAPEITEVTIQDNEGKTLSNNVATNLLKLITDGINQGLSEKTPEEPADSSPAP